ncbi:unnamed protein product, partial [Mesorhabditis spiculigera]
MLTLLQTDFRTATRKFKRSFVRRASQMYNHFLVRFFVGMYDVLISVYGVRFYAACFDPAGLFERYRCGLHADHQPLAHLALESFFVRPSASVLADFGAVFVVSLFYFFAVTNRQKLLERFGKVKLLIIIAVVLKAAGDFWVFTDRLRFKSVSLG